MAKIKITNASKKIKSKKVIHQKTNDHKIAGLREVRRRRPVTLAKDIMSTSLVVLNEERTFGHAVELLTLKRLTVLPVVDGQGKLLGILSEKDILKACDSFEGNGAHFLDQRIQYETNVVTVNINTPISELGFLLANRVFRHLPVLDQEGFLKGIISRRDLIRVIYLRYELQKVADLDQRI